MTETSFRELVAKYTELRRSTTTSARKLAKLAKLRELIQRHSRHKVSWSLLK